jgi:hypothetical protein
VFDIGCDLVFGTVVDWRGSVIRDGEELSRRTGVKTDWAAFADAWRGEYGPSMQPIREGTRPWVDLAVLHYENLLTMVKKLGVQGSASRTCAGSTSPGTGSSRGPMLPKASPASSAVSSS